MRSARHGWTHAQGLYPADLGVDVAIVMQVQASIRRRPRVEGITVALGEELRARRGRPHEAHAVTFAVVRLMNVAPCYSAHMRVRIDDAPEFLGVGEPDAIQPAAAHPDRVMMQT